MIAEALKFLASIQTPQRPQTILVGDVYHKVNVDGTLGDRVDARPYFYQPTFQVSTLSAFAGLLKAQNEAISQLGAKPFCVHIVDPFTVQSVAIDCNAYGQRHIFAEAKHKAESPFKFNAFYEPEAFLIDFRSSFLCDEEALKVQQICSSVASGDAVSVADDGVSQEVTLKSGTITRSAIQLPAEGVSLIPWRTFRDAAPVQSKFLLRMKGYKDALPRIALFEIDAKWQLDTVHAIRKYLAKELPEGTAILA